MWPRIPTADRDKWLGSSSPPESLTDWYRARTSVSSTPLPVDATRSIVPKTPCSSPLAALTWRSTTQGHYMDLAMDAAARHHAACPSPPPSLPAAIAPGTLAQAVDFTAPADDTAEDSPDWGGEPSPPDNTLPASVPPQYVTQQCIFLDSQTPEGRGPGGRA